MIKKNEIFINNLNTEAIIGIHDFEKLKSQRLTIDVSLYTNQLPAAKEDDINCAVDYDRVSQFLDKFIRSSKYQLIETLAERCVEQLFIHFPLVDAILFKLQKPGAIKLTQQVGISIYRER